MNYRLVAILLFMLKAFSSFAAGADTVKLFYDINQYDLSFADKTEINTLVKSLSATDTVKIIGYADYLGNDKDNMTLSEKRAETIFNYLLTLPKSLLVITEWKGGVHASSKKSVDGEPLNRRVDIVKAIRTRNKNLTPALATNKPVIGKQGRVQPKISEKPQVISEKEDKRPFADKINDLANLDIGSSISLQEITFQPGRHFLNPEAVPYVVALLKYLKKHSNIVFEIQGHICCANDDGDSYDYDTRAPGLSTNRAKLIYDYFLQNGISADRMTYKGLGSSKPKVWPEYSEHDRYLNRRVEILVLRK